MSYGDVNNKASSASPYFILFINSPLWLLDGSTVVRVGLQLLCWVFHLNTVSWQEVAKKTCNYLSWGKQAERKGLMTTASSFVYSIEESKLLNCLKLFRSSSYFLVGKWLSLRQCCEVGKDGINQLWKPFYRCRAEYQRSKWLSFKGE